LRCHPWCAGGCDPVPPGRLFSCAPKSELPPDLPPDLPPESRSERNLTP
jgi:hypothetical protein